MTRLDPHQALGAFLRAQRERLPPPANASSRRRTPGRRREEIAEASGVSLTWLTWLEQGRAVSASSSALARLADALCLSPAERLYLFDLAGRHDPAAPAPDMNDLPAAILDLPQRMTIPAYLLDGSWTAQSWNAPAAQLFAGWLDKAHDRNLLRFIFCSDVAPRLIADWPDRAQRVVAEFRAESRTRLTDPALQALIQELSAGSAYFSTLWQDHAVLGREGGERRFNDPARRYYQSTLVLSSHPEIKLVSLTPMDS